MHSLHNKACEGIAIIAAGLLHCINKCAKLSVHVAHQAPDAQRVHAFRDG